jgi:hypothetical protein
MEALKRLQIRQAAALGTAARFRAYGPFARPVLTVDPGAVVSCETHDAFEGAIRLATDKPSEKLNFPFLNP